ncbi:MAG: NADP-specific glutamate dehydrogenase [Bacilli bacterium]|jgi:glutamate dehydrogenase (NADP+)
MLKLELSKKVYQRILNLAPKQKEYLETVESILESLEAYLTLHSSQLDEESLTSLFIPEKVVTFNVNWQDDQGQLLSNKGYRIQFNSTLGPYKGGLRFHPSVNESVFKFLALEQSFKNALTGFNLGGAKGGANFDTKGKSASEIKRFCETFITKLAPHIGADIDIPAGDIGVGSQEISYLYHEFCRLNPQAEKGSFTGKDLKDGGSYLRKEATGYGLCYFTEAALKRFLNSDFKKKKIIISGSGNVAIHTALKVQELGAIIVAMSDSSSLVYDPKGLNITSIQKIKEKRGRIKEYLKTCPNSLYSDDPQAIWDFPCDIALPCATQNELDLPAAKKLKNNACLAVCEGANKPCTKEAVDFLVDNRIIFGPSKAANAGGVIVSYFEMLQNAKNEQWSFQEVDQKLKENMLRIFEDIFETAKTFGNKYDLNQGANILAFKRLIKADF